ncbi:uncharacterized protein LOC126687475 [Mercurialis annua]|uniref:uncharacterized protein LOC126687475 n=1 Tax=Mercurialis annua TaxID=3986 RepID=UPI00215E9E68|nr:uncharacterized protein LOC126687475 [Mercurialis annua]
MLSFWGITKPLIASWSWRNLIKLRQDIKGWFEHKLGKGELSFWHDPWLKGKVITELFPNTVIDEFDIPKHAKNSFPISINLDTEDRYIPKHSFIAWLAIKGKLRTRDKLKSWGCVDDDGCVLCNIGTESLEHLFFNCRVSSVVLRNILCQQNLSNMERKKQTHFSKVYDILKSIRQNILLKLFSKKNSSEMFIQLYHRWHSIN